MSSSATSYLNVRISSHSDRLAEDARHELVRLLLDATTSSFPAGFNLAIVDAQYELLRAWSGDACLIGDRVSTKKKTIYDLASLTKVIATATLTLQLVERKKLQLDDKLQRWLPDYPRDDTTLRHLLTHTSGLVAHRPFYMEHQGRHAVQRALYDEAALDGPAGNVLYSDLNFMLLGWVIEACVGAPLDVIFAEYVAIPLGMNDTRFCPSPTRRRQIAATELDGDQRLELGLVWGEVHDGNAWALGGVSGHAGLFAPMSDVVTFVRALLDPLRQPILQPETITAMTSPLVGASPTQRGLGWSVNQVEWGEWPEGNFWHTGFTGTSLLVCPALGIAVVLLSNAIHPQRQLDRQAQFRRDVHNAIARCFQ